MSGFSRLPEGYEVHIDDLVAKTLCKKHNEETSDLDQAFIDTLNCIRETERLRRARAGNRNAWYASVKLTADGSRLERFVLKMVMNFSVVLRPYLDGWEPPSSLPAMIFGREPVLPDRGLGMLVRPGDQLVDGEQIQVAFGISERTGAPMSMMLEPRQGWRFLCSWERPLMDLAGNFNIDDATYFQEDVLPKPGAVNFDNGVSLRFDWSGRWSDSRFPEVARLRESYKAPPRKRRR